MFEPNVGIDLEHISLLLVHIYLLICISCHCKHDCAYIIFIFILISKSLCFHYEWVMGKYCVILGIAYKVMLPNINSKSLNTIKLKLMLVWWYKFMCNVENEEKLNMCAVFFPSNQSIRFLILQLNIHLGSLKALQSYTAKCLYISHMWRNEICYERKEVL